MFLHPWAIAIGVAAAALPFVVHWLTRPRPVRRPLSTLRFVREAVRQRRARYRLRDFVVLALRTAAVLLLAAAVARPLLGDRAPATEESSGGIVRVVILDASASMDAVHAGMKTFERGRSLASRKLAHEPKLKANLILAAARPRPVFTLPASNLAALREELAEAAPRPERLDVQAALNLASDMLAGAGDEDVRRELVILSDLQRSNWARADFSVLPADTKIELEALAPESPPSNLAVLRVYAAGRAEVNQEFPLQADVGNFSATPRQVLVDVTLGDATYRLEGLCPPRSVATLSTPIRPRQAGWHVGEARLVRNDDALPADDRRPCVLEVLPPPTYALLTRQGAGERPSSSYYLERALAPFDDRSPPDAAASPAEETAAPPRTRIVRMTPADLDLRALATVDLVVVDHPGRLDEATINHLAAMLRRGTGVLYVAAEPVDATNLKLLAQAAGGGLQMPVEFAPPPAGRIRRDLFLTEVGRDDGPFAIFGDQLSAAIAPLRFSGGLTSRRLESGLADDVLATFDDRTACLVRTSADAGVLAVLNADLEHSNLHRSELFVPLLDELVSDLLGGRGDSREFPAGEPLAVTLPGSAGGTHGLVVDRVRPPSGSSRDELDPAAQDVAPGELVLEGTGVVWRMPHAAPPGVYEVRRGNATVFALATGIPAEEADLSALSAEVFETRLAGDRQVRYRSALAAEDDGADRLWTWLALACAMCLLGEVAALRWFRT
ncbi:MAG: VWA domain-containing protein [Planctomycetaceae bacterium]